MSLALDLASTTLSRITNAVAATEVLAPDGGPFLYVPATVDGGATGTMRVFSAAMAPKIVTTVLEVPSRGVVTCMVFAFAHSDSALPHFTLDCSDRGGNYAFHLDVLPRVELATHVEYMDAVFAPLTETFDSASALDGLSRTATTPQQHAMMSPWMLVHFADEEAFTAIFPTVATYADHWCTLIRDGLPGEVVATTADTDLINRDQAVRRNLFSPEIDPVWDRVGAMLGESNALRIREQLRSIELQTLA